MILRNHAPGALFIFFVAWILPAAAVVVNRTIDDFFGDSDSGRSVVYLPTTVGVWKDETCSDCSILPDVTRTFKGTYTAATYNPELTSMSITMDFNGTAIYAFFVLINNAGDGITALTEANFTLDGEAPQLFQHAPDLTTTDIDYNSLVFSKSNLVNAQHRLVISTSGAKSNIYVNFDYAIYTHDDDAPLLPLPPPGSPPPTTSPPASLTTTKSTTTTSKPTTSSQPDSSTGTPQSDTQRSASTKTPVGAIAGGVIGGIVVLTLIILLLFLCRRRNRRLHRRQETEGYVPALMSELNLSSGNRAQATGTTSTISPLVAQSTYPSNNYRQAYGSSGASTPGQSMGYSPRTPLTQSEVNDSAYGGYVLDHQSSSAGDGAPSSSSDLYRSHTSRPTLRSVTSGDHISTPTYGDAIHSSTMQSRSLPSQPIMVSSPGAVEDIRRARQNEIDQRLRTVQEEMMHLTSDLRGEKSGHRQSVRRQRTVNQGNRQIDEGEGEMTMSEMKEQLRMMKEQIAFLQDQQRSEWAQGLSDDPPPGYSPVTATSDFRYSSEWATAGTARTTIATTGT